MQRCAFTSLAATCVLCLGHIGLANVTSSATNGFQIQVVRQVTAEPQHVYAAILAIDKWWSPAHTYSGDAANLSIDLRRGSFEEKLPGGGHVRHMEIVFQDPGKSFRMAGGLGPLQGMGIYGALTLTMSSQAGKTQIELTYNVSGYAPNGLAVLAPIVDGVLTEQLERLCRYCEAGAVDLPAATEAATHVRPSER